MTHNWQYEVILDVPQLLLYAEDDLIRMEPHPIMLYILNIYYQVFSTNDNKVMLLHNFINGIILIMA